MMSVLEYALDMNKEVSTVLKKCKELGIDFIGTDIELEYCEIAEKRLKGGH